MARQRWAAMSDVERDDGTILRCFGEPAHRVVPARGEALQAPRTASWGGDRSSPLELRLAVATP